MESDPQDPYRSPLRIRIRLNLAAACSAATISAFLMLLSLPAMDIASGLAGLAQLSRYFGLAVLVAAFVAVAPLPVAAWIWRQVPPVPVPAWFRRLDKFFNPGFTDRPPTLYESMRRNFAFESVLAWPMMAALTATLGIATWAASDRPWETWKSLAGFTAMVGFMHLFMTAVCVLLAEGCAEYRRRRRSTE